MELGSRARRRKSHFHPFKSFIGKKQTAAAAAYAEQRSNDVPILRKLTVGLIDTYEAINTSYYHKKDQEAAAAAQAQTAARDVTDALAATSLQHDSSHHATNALPSQSVPSSAKPPTDSVPPSPQAVQYCDENYDYIVRTGDLFNNRYMLEKVIGRGSFGQVVRAYDTHESIHVAIKIIKNNSLYVEQAISEVRMTAYLNRIDPDDEHAIMRLRDKFIYRGHQCLVLELLSFSLYDLLRSTEFFGVSLNLVRKFAKQILRCLAFLARPDINVAHCDLKPENVLLRHPQRSAIKVVDFGASCRVSDAMFTYVQSRFYRAPEVILGIPYDTQVDVWSLGCMLVELHTGYPLFAGRDEGDQISIIVERIGMPPRRMLDQGKKTHAFFEKDPTTGEWSLKQGIARKEDVIVPGSKPVAAFVEELTGSGSGKRKRSSDGHSDFDYQIFLNLTSRMLQFDPKYRISADEALNGAFFTGSATSPGIPGINSHLSTQKSGRDSPPCLPSLNNAVNEAVPELEPGRKAPVQPLLGTNGRGVSLDMNHERHSSMSNEEKQNSNASEERNLSDVNSGGSLRISKSETAIDMNNAMAPPSSSFALHASTWAEEVGIEPPPWRAEYTVSRRRRSSDGSLLAAGGGERRPRPARRKDNVLNRRLWPLRNSGVLVGAGSSTRTVSSRSQRRTGIVASATPATKFCPFPMGTTVAAVEMARKDFEARRLAAMTAARPPPLRVAGHGDALLLERDGADERRLALANTQPATTVASLYF